jgi:LPXTG-site transpeptidase (sortase) family protein
MMTLRSVAARAGSARGAWRTTSGARLFRRGAMAAALALSVVALAACGGSSKKADSTATGTTLAGTSTPAGTPTMGANAGLKTPIPISAGNSLAPGDLAARGVGVPGRGDFRGQRLVIPSIGVDASFSMKQVGTDGQMPNPDGPTDVAYYDFSQWPGMGGLPGKGGNVVLAGHVDYINYGPAVFWRLHELAAGDMIDVTLDDGTSATYRVEFNKQIEVGDADWSSIVQATADESITLITCGGEFEAGHYNNRQIVWGRRV